MVYRGLKSHLESEVAKLRVHEFCRRQLVEEPIAICNLKRFAADQALMTKPGYRPEQLPLTGKRVAIVGAGWYGYKSITPELSYREIMYEAAVRAYNDAGINPRTDVDSFITVAEDMSHR